MGYHRKREREREGGEREGERDERDRERGGERQTDTKRERAGGRMQCFVKKEDKSLIDVDNVVTTSELTNTIGQFMVYLHRN